MRRFLLISLALLLFIGVVAGAGAYVMASKAPFLPGDWLFPTQIWAEQVWGLTFNHDAASRADVLLNLLERRLDNLEAVRGTADEWPALVIITNAMNQATQAIADAPETEWTRLRGRLTRLTERAIALMDGLDVMQGNEVETAVLNIYTQLQSLLAALTGSETAVAALPGLDGRPAGENSASETAVQDKRNTLPGSRRVPFPEGSVDHSFFPLNGGHGNIECETCHTNGTYQGTSAACAACHAQDDTHNGAYGADCATCHSISDWQNVNFDHSFIGSQDCAACHTAPVGHYAGACSACHSDTENFANATFNHDTIGGTDCVACHTAPAGHYSGACSACHSDTSNFRNATFNHATIGGTDCSACHAPPANHFNGECRACHQDTGNFRNATFNHATIGGTDCSACHAPPANHYGGECRACHQDTGNFRNATFNHATIGGTDCAACHAPPANHYGGECRACHQDTGNFRNATFNHATIGGTDCSACHAPPANHYPGACTACHTDTGNFRNVNFNHAGLTDCQSCHAPPANHFPGQCSDCHTTNTWGGASFNHTFPINHEGANGQCATCHPGGDTATYTCTSCHDYNKMDKEHDEENNYSHNCVACHANGKDPDD